MSWTWREGSLQWTPKDVLSKVLVWVSVKIGAPLLGNMEGRFLVGPSRLRDMSRGI